MCGFSDGAGERGLVRVNRVAWNQKSQKICLSASFIFIRKRVEFTFELLALDFPLLSVPGGVQLICLFDATGLNVCV